MLYFILVFCAVFMLLFISVRLSICQIHLLTKKNILFFVFFTILTLVSCVSCFLTNKLTWQQINFNFLVLATESSFYLLFSVIRFYVFEWMSAARTMKLLLNFLVLGKMTIKKYRMYRVYCIVSIISYCVISIYNIVSGLQLRYLYAQFLQRSRGRIFLTLMTVEI